MSGLIEKLKKSNTERLVQKAIKLGISVQADNREWLIESIAQRITQEPSLEDNTDSTADPDTHGESSTHTDRKNNGTRSQHSRTTAAEHPSEKRREIRATESTAKSRYTYHHGGRKRDA